MCWITPLVERVTGDPGNLTALAEYSSSGRGVIGTMSPWVSSPVTWAGSRHGPARRQPSLQHPVSSLPHPRGSSRCLSVALAAGAWLARRRRATEILLLQVTVVVGAFAGAAR